MRKFDIKAFTADTLTMLVYATPICMGIEMGVMKMSLYESLSARGLAQPVNFATSRPYGKWRNFLFKKGNVKEDSSFVKKSLTEMLAFGSCQAPLYGAITGTTKIVSESMKLETPLYQFQTLMNGASNVDWSDVGSGVGLVTALSPVIGPTYGWVNDKVRSYFGVPSATEHK